MAIKLTRKTARFVGVCSVEEAEPLLEWVQGQVNPRADLSACEHLHTALLQILLARHVHVTALPKDPWLCHWVAPLARQEAGAAAAAASAA